MALAKGVYPFASITSIGTRCLSSTNTTPQCPAADIQIETTNVWGELKTNMTESTKAPDHFQLQCATQSLADWNV